MSYAIGQIIADVLVKRNKVTWFENQNYIGDQLTSSIGVLAFGWLIRHSFMGWFNKKLRLKSSASLDDLKRLKQEMGYAEAGHLVAFYVLLAVNLIFIYLGLEWWYILIFLILNVIFNLYLVLLQQYNKRRVQKLIKAYG